MKLLIINIICLFAGLSLLGSCSHTFLDAKPSSDIVVPTRLEELQGLLDNENVVFQTPLLGTVSADEFYLKRDDWMALYQNERNAYIWAADVYEDYGFDILDWNVPYTQVFYANIVLEGVNELDPAMRETQEAREVAGSALFLRARAFFNLAEHFAMPFDPATAETYPGIPLRLSPDVNTVAPRGTVAETYHRILADMLQAKRLLPDTGLPANRLRPNVLTCYGYLARISLAMGNYDMAGRYADSALMRYANLIDYNSINPAAANPFPPANPETILQNILLSGSALSMTVSGIIHVDSVLYSLYAPDDLRKAILFSTPGNRIMISKSYSGLINFFSGLTTAELFLIRAECYARSGNMAAAANDLNTLMEKRYRTGTFTTVTPGSGASLLELILLERRRELCFRGLRWSDIRRLNVAGAGIVQKRVLDGDTIVLQPNGPRYALPFPKTEIDRTGVVQNPR